MKFERRSARAARWPLPLQLSSQLSSRQHHCDYSVWRWKATRAKQQHGRLTRLIERAFVGRGFTDLEPRPATARYFQSKDALVPCHRNPPQNSAASPARDTAESCGEHARSEPARGLLFLWPVLETDHSGQRNVTSAPARAPHSGCMRRDGREGFRRCAGGPSRPLRNARPTPHSDPLPAPARVVTSCVVPAEGCVPAAQTLDDTGVITYRDCSCRQELSRTIMRGERNRE